MYIQVYTPANEFMLDLPEFLQVMNATASKWF